LIKKKTNKKKRLCGVCKLPGHNKTTLSRSKINFFKQKFRRILDQSTIVKWGFKAPIKTKLLFNGIKLLYQRTHGLDSLTRVSYTDTLIINFNVAMENLKFPLNSLALIWKNSNWINMNL
jgi:hypothetical protein